MAADTLAILHAAGLEAKAKDLAKEVGGDGNGSGSGNGHGGGVRVSAVDGFDAAAAGSFKKVIIFLPAGGDEGATAGALGACFGALAPQGELVVKLCGDGGADATAALKTQLLIAGFVGVEALPASATSDASLIAQKPNWEVGSTASVSIPPTTAKGTWKLGAGEVQDDDLVDPDALLEESDGLLAAVQAKKAEAGDGGCATKKRACKNCSCGRAEQEAAGGDAPTMTDEELKASVSSCGNCYKGDAFRCGGCPFLGMPAFEPGQEKVMLKLSEVDS